MSSTEPIVRLLVRTASLVAVLAAGVVTAHAAGGGGGGGGGGTMTGGASAVDDFATCPATLPACTEEANDCCYKAFPEDSGKRAVIIPMDRCHQRVATSGTEGPPSNSDPAWCESYPSSSDEGMYQVYGLVYRLMQNDINVYWLVNPTKDPAHLHASENAASQTYTERDIDAWVLASGVTTPPERGSGNLPSCLAADGCEQPVRKINPATMTSSTGTYQFNAFPVRGSAFVIAPEDRDRFDALIKRTGEFASRAGDSHYDFSAIDMYELGPNAQFAYQNFASAGPAYSLGAPLGNAPVAVRIDYAPPRLARLAPAGVSEVWLTTAKLDDEAQGPECKSGDFVPEDAVFCDVSEEDIQAGVLHSGRFEWAWLDNWSDNSPCGNFGETTQVDNVLQFLTATPGFLQGGNTMFMDAVIDVFEGASCGSRQPLGALGDGVATLNQTPNPEYIIRYPSSTFVQWGDLPPIFASGSAAKWDYHDAGSAGGYQANPTMVRLVTEDRSATGNALCTNHVSDSTCDMYGLNSNADTVDFSTYGRYLGNTQNGIAFYQGGNNVNGRAAHLRMILNAFITVPRGRATPNVTSTREVSRSAPIVASVSGGPETQFQGTFEVDEPEPVAQAYSGAADDATFEFPFFRGHLRGYDLADVSDSATDFDTVTALFDAADGIPTANPGGCGSATFGSTCRTVFTTTTNTTTGLVTNPERVYFSTANRNALRPLLGATLPEGSFTDAEVDTLISRVLAGTPDGSGGYVSTLGGIDRSTMAVIEPSPFVPGADARPTMIYVGGLDGMLHAICAEAKTGTGCGAAGQELWAMIPRTQLPFLRTNTQRIDGSPKVADVFDDFGGEFPEWRTVLTFQTGSGVSGFSDRMPATIAIDISDPEDPIVLWERTAPDVRGEVEHGEGLNLAMGLTRVGGASTNLVFVQTNNGGTGASSQDLYGGFYIGAYDTVDGTLVWEFERMDSPRDSNRMPALPTTGIPGGVAAYSDENSALVTHLAVATLKGELFKINASDGTSVYTGLDPNTLEIVDIPLFSFSGDLHPIGASPTIYFDQLTGRYYSVIVSGGYVDPVRVAWTDTTDSEYAVSVALDAAEGNVTIDEAGGGFGDDRAFVFDLGAGNAATAQAVVAGGDLFIAVDSGDVNSPSYGSSPTGSLTRLSLSNGNQVGSTQAIAGGASSVGLSADAGNVVLGSGSKAQKLDQADTFGTTVDAGSIVERNIDPDTTRLLWISG